MFAVVKTTRALLAVLAEDPAVDLTVADLAWRVGRAVTTVYPLMASLVDEGLATVRPEVTHTPGRSRYLYRITELGQKYEKEGEKR